MECPPGAKWGLHFGPSPISPLDRSRATRFLATPLPFPLERLTLLPVSPGIHPPLLSSQLQFFPYRSARGFPPCDALVAVGGSCACLLFAPLLAAGFRGPIRLFLASPAPPVVMAALVNYGGGDDVCLLSRACKVDLYCAPRKRTRVVAPRVFRAEEEVVAVEKQKTCSIDSLPDECLFEILRRLPGDKERSNSACVSKRWLMLLSGIRSAELAARKKLGDESIKKPLPDLNNDALPDEQENENSGHLTRCLDAEEATDIKLASIALGTCSRGGLGKLFIRGSNSTRVTDVGLCAIAHACPSLKVLSLWRVPFVTDASLLEIADGCPLLEKLDLSWCPQISDKGLAAIAQKCPKLTSLTIESCSSISNEGLQTIGRCCPNLKSIAIGDCLLVGDQGIASLVSSPSSSLERIKLETLNISDMALAVVGHYGKNLVEITLSGLHNVTEKGFWVMGNTLGLRKLRSIAITACNGFTDLGLQAVAKGSPYLRQLFVRKSCSLSDAGLNVFAETARVLQNLHLEDCNRFTLAGIVSVLSRCNPRLQSLRLVRCMGIKDAPLCPIQLPTCMSLKSLTIRDCPGVTSASLLVLGQICPQLQNVDLSGLAGITDAALIPLIEGSNTGFVEVNLSGCVNVTDASITLLVKSNGSTLKTLNLDGCKKLTDRSLRAIAYACFALDDLDLSSCSVTDHGVAVLAKARQLNLRVLSLASCSKLTERSLPFLGKFGFSLVGLNLQHCNSIMSRATGLLKEKLWWCDILS